MHALIRKPLLAILFLMFLGCSRGGMGVSTSIPTTRVEAAAQTIDIHPAKDNPSTMIVEVTGLSEAAIRSLSERKLTTEEWQNLLAVYVTPEPGREMTSRIAVSGDYQVGGKVRFTPRYPLKAGITYRVEWHPGALPGNDGKEPPLVAEYSTPKPPASSTTVVEQVYPSRQVLPENQLKFYFHFSAPMSRGESYRHIQLLDAAGKAVELPFLELDEELWDPAGKRFTLFIDPGRIKRGLKPREDVGPALEAGKSYTLLIYREWQDAAGNTLKETFRKPFRVGPPDETQPDPKTWKIDMPAAGTKDRLIVISPKPLDHALFQRLVGLQDEKGQEVAGTLEIAAEETRWEWTPTDPWRAGDYRLVIGTALEDLAGNSVGRPFEVDVFRPITTQVQAESVTRRIQIK